MFHKLSLPLFSLLVNNVICLNLECKHWDFNIMNCCHALHLCYCGQRTDTTSQSSGAVACRANTWRMYVGRKSGFRLEMEARLSSTVLIVEEHMYVESLIWQLWWPTGRGIGADQLWVSMIKHLKDQLCVPMIEALEQLWVSTFNVVDLGIKNWQQWCSRIIHTWVQRVGCLLGSKQSKGQSSPNWNRMEERKDLEVIKSKEVEVGVL